MAKRTEIQDLIDIQGLVKALKTDLPGAFEEAFKRIRERSKELVKELNDISTVLSKNIDTLNRASTAADRLAKDKQKLTAAEKELQRIQKEEERLTARLNALNDGKANKVIRLREEYKKLAAEKRKAAQASLGMEKSGSRLNTLFGNLAKSAIAYVGAIAGFTAVIGLFKRFYSEVLKTTKQLDSLDLTLRMVVRDNLELRQTQYWLIDTAKAYGISLIDLTERYAKFRAAAIQSNMTAADTQKIFDSMARSGAVLGLKTDEIRGVFLALEQMISKGKITTEELRRQLGERLPGAFGIMAKSMDISIPKLDEMLKKGEVLSHETLPAFAEAILEAYGIQNVDRVDTLVAAQERLRISWIEFVDALDSSDTYKRIFDFLTKSVENLTKLIQGTEAFKETQAEKALTNLETKLRDIEESAAKAFKGGDDAAKKAEIDKIYNAKLKAILDEQDKLAERNREIQAELEEKGKIKTDFLPTMEKILPFKALQTIADLLAGDVDELNEELAINQKQLESILLNYKEWAEVTTDLGENTDDLTDSLGLIAAKRQQIKDVMDELEATKSTREILILNNRLTKLNYELDKLINIGKVDLDIKIPKDIKPEEIDWDEVFGTDKPDLILGKVQLLEKELKKLQEFEGLADTVDVAVMWREQINAIQKEIDDFNRQIDIATAENPIAKLLNITDEEAESLVDDVASLTQEVLDVWKDFTETRLDLAQQEVDYRTGRIAELQRELEAEIRINEQGLASNIATKKRQIEEEKKLRDKALADEKKAQQTMLAVNAITTGANLTLTVSNIIKDYSEIPFIGWLLGIAAAGVMLSQFSKTKKQAQQMSKFAKGEINIKGKKHSQGGIPAEIEGGESVISAKGTKGSEKSLELINKGLLKDNDLWRLNFHREFKTDQVISIKEFKNLEKEVREQTNSTKDLVSYMKSKTDVYQFGNTRIERKGSKTKIIRAS